MTLSMRPYKLASDFFIEHKQKYWTVEFWVIYATKWRQRYRLYKVLSSVILSVFLLITLSVVYITNTDQVSESQIWYIIPTIILLIVLAVVTVKIEGHLERLGQLLYQRKRRLDDGARLFGLINAEAMMKHSNAQLRKSADDLIRKLARSVQIAERESASYPYDQARKDAIAKFEQAYTTLAEIEFVADKAAYFPRPALKTVPLKPFQES